MQILALEEEHEERLNEVLTLVGAVSLAPHVCVERVPIDFAQLGKSPAGGRRTAASGGQDKAPSRGVEM